jgi:hypothetical protein
MKNTVSSISCVHAGGALTAHVCCYRLDDRRPDKDGMQRESGNCKAYAQMSGSPAASQRRDASDIIAPLEVYSRTVPDVFGSGKCMHRYDRWYFENQVPFLSLEGSRLPTPLFPMAVIIQAKPQKASDLAEGAGVHKFDGWYHENQVPFVLHPGSPRGIQGPGHFSRIHVALPIAKRMQVGPSAGWNVCSSSVRGAETQADAEGRQPDGTLRTSIPIGQDQGSADGQGGALPYLRGRGLPGSVGTGNGTHCPPPPMSSREASRVTETQGLPPLDLGVAKGAVGAAQAGTVEHGLRNFGGGIRASAVDKVPVRPIAETAFQCQFGLNRGA